jgi:hypothetical protein
LVAVLAHDPDGEGIRAEHLGDHVLDTGHDLIDVD